jgi:predicted secreted Zn-dependent protease
MRLLVLAVILPALGAASYWVLTEGPLAPASVELVSADSLRAAATALAAGDDGSGPPPGPPPKPDRPPIQVDRTHETYAVTGKTADEVLRSLLDHGPRDGESIYFGLTETALDVRYDPTVISGGCIIQDAEVDLDLVVTLPEWMPAPGTDPALLRDWGRFRRALAQHEERHQTIALDGAQAAYRAVAGLYRGSCEEAVAEARGRLERLGVEVSAAHRRYDHETKHGRTEGAAWPVP